MLAHVRVTCSIYPAGELIGSGRWEMKGWVDVLQGLGGLSVPHYYAISSCRAVCQAC